MARFHSYRQLDSADCGPACLRMIGKHYGKEHSLTFLRESSSLSRQGTSMSDLSDTAEKVGFKTMTVRIPLEILIKEQPFPCILHWKQNHFIVLYKAKNGVAFVADPAVGRLKYSLDEMRKHWALGDPEDNGIALLLEPVPTFYSNKYEQDGPKWGLSYFAKYLLPYKKLVIQLMFGLLAGSLLNLIIPFLTQSLVDIGVSKNNLSFVYLILIAQLMFFVGGTTITVIRSWVLLHISSRLNITIISDFLLKLMKLPIAFFDARNLGDILQRIRDHDRLRVFLTSSSIQTLFSLFNILVFGIVLVSFNFSLFIIFISGSVFYFIWILLFLKSRRIIDYKKFSEAAASQSNEVQLVQGMQEIKLNQAENAKRWEWEAIQARLFNISIKSLTIEQYQNAGGSFINELKNIVILFWSAQAVMKGEMTLGMMLAATQITGQLNAPIAQLIGFIQQAQDASISLERLGEIHQKENEDNEQFSIPQVSHYRADIGVENLSFRYFGAESPLVLSDVSFRVKYGKTTAIVGRSGSGKTTLLKLILKFYKPLSGKIKVGEVDLSGLDTAFWRKNCGTVMQDGYVFSDTILKNITISEEQPDMLKFKKALNIANITDFVDELPLNFNTKIGTSGIGLSQGQKQRIMIARAVYKNPDFLFFDEATSSLDAENEKVISDNLLEFAQGRTMVVIAHRLSTVKRADHIVVLERGRIVETGSHAELIGTKGHYYTLVRNQLELGE